MSWLPSPRIALALALILLLAAGLRIVIASQAPVFLAFRDSSQFFAAGYDLVHGGGFDLPLKRAPLYPLFLAGVIATFGPSLEAVATVQHLLGLGTVLMVYALGALVFGRATGLLAALAAALNGALVLMEHSIYAEALLAPLLLGSVVALAASLGGGERETATGSRALTLSRSHALTLCLLAGLLLGLGALARPVAQSLLPLFLAVVLLQRCSWRRRALLGGMLALGYVLVVGPWLVRNRLEHGDAAISGGLGDSLYARTHRYDPGFTWRDQGAPPADPLQAQVRQRIFETHHKHARGPEFRAELRSEFGLTEAQSDAALRDAAIQVIKQEPVRYLSGTLAMFVELALFYDDPLEEGWWSRSRPGYERAWPEPVRDALEDAPIPSRAERARVNALAGIYQDRQLGLLVGLLFLLGIGRCLRAGRGEAILLPLVVVSQILVYVALDGPHYRYRYPLQPFITLVACGGLTWALAWVAGHDRLRTHLAVLKRRVTHPRGVPGQIQAPSP